MRSGCNEGSSMPPTAAHNKLAEWLARSRRQFPLTQLFRKGLRVAGIANGHCRHGLPIRGKREALPRLIGIESSHLVYLQAARVRLKSKLRAGAAYVMQRHAVRF